LDCESGFSAQNQTKTAERNRLGSQTVKDIMMVKLKGGHMKTFNFMRALELWRGDKVRK